MPFLTSQFLIYPVINTFLGDLFLSAHSPHPSICSIVYAAFEAEHCVSSKAVRTGTLGIVTRERTWSESEAKLR